MVKLHIWGVEWMTASTEEIEKSRGRADRERSLSDGVLAVEGLSPAFLRNSNGRLDLPGPTQEAS